MDKTKIWSIIAVIYFAVSWAFQIFVPYKAQVLVSTLLLFGIALLLQTLFRVLRRGIANVKAADDIFITARGLLAVVLLVSSVLMVRSSMAHEKNDLPWAVGNIIMQAGLIIRIAAQFVLRWSWSVGVVIGGYHKLVTTWPYSVIRHPMYLNYFTMGIGLTIATQSWLLGVLWGTYLMLVVQRAKLEEKLLCEQKRYAYEEYMARTGMFLPRLKGGSKPTPTP